MTTRRNLLKSIGLSTLALSTLSAYSCSEGRKEEATAMPNGDDPEYWQKLRKQFMLADDKVFFNTGTVGVMPRVVVEAVTKHLNYMAADVADWPYKGG